MVDHSNWPEPGVVGPLVTIYFRSVPIWGHVFDMILVAEPIPLAEEALVLFTNIIKDLYKLCVILTYTVCGVKLLLAKYLTNGMPLICNILVSPNSVGTYWGSGRNLGSQSIESSEWTRQGGRQSAALCDIMRELRYMQAFLPYLRGSPPAGLVRLHQSLWEARCLKLPRRSSTFPVRIVTGMERNTQCLNAWWFCFWAVEGMKMYCGTSCWTSARYVAWRAPSLKTPTSSNLSCETDGAPAGLSSQAASAAVWSAGRMISGYGLTVQL